MGDNDTMACPLQSFSSAEFPSTNSNLYNSDNQNSLAPKDDRKEGVREGSLTLSLPKKFDESQDSQDELPNPDLHNGHNNPDAINIANRAKNTGNFLEESEELQGGMDICSKGGQNSEKAKEESNKVVMEHEQAIPASRNSQEENSQQEKALDDSVSQDFFDDSKNSSNDKIEQSNSNQDTENSEGFDLHLSETQSFLPSGDKENVLQTVSESEEDSQNATENEKNRNEGGEDIELSNGSSSNQEETKSPKQSEQEVPKSNGETENTDSEKPEALKPESEESLSNGEVGVTEVDEKHCEEKSLEEEGSSKAEIKGEDKRDDKENVEESVVKEGKVTPEATRVSSRQQLRKQRKEEGEKEEKPEAMEMDSSGNKAASEPEDSTCSCEPACHTRIKLVSRHLNSACFQLDEFIKLKRRDENKVLKGFLDMLKEISSISENGEIKGETKISDHVLIPDTSSKRKASKRKSNDLDTPLKETPRKRAAEERSAKKSAEKEKKSSVDFKDLKGLAVFAKWPNSGWYYPGKVEELSGSDWKEVSNVTVKFYDGLVREMKNINILPAHLIPPGSSLSDLEDETEMIVLSCDGSNQNSVEFKLSTKDSSEEIELNFNKLAIKANHMKTIKQQLDSTTDVSSKKTHMVSLDNLVSGRRSRVRSKKDDSDTEEKTTVQSERSSRSSSSTTPAKKVGTPRRARN